MTNFHDSKLHGTLEKGQEIFGSGRLGRKYKDLRS